MAKYTAATRIKHGAPDGVMVFEIGDEVTGLSKEAMKELWDAGALRADDGTTSDAMQPDLTAEVRESVTPEGETDISTEEVAERAPDGGEDTQKGTTDSTEKATSPSPTVTEAPKSTTATKPTSTAKPGSSSTQK